MFEIYSFCSNQFLNTIILISSFMCLSYLVAFFKKEKNPFISDFLSKETNFSAAALKTAAMFVHLFFCFCLLFGSTFFIVDTIGCDDLRAQPDGTYCYYIEATNSKEKTYILPARIYKTDGTYSVDKVYFNNGGYLSLTGNDGVEFGEVITDNDQDDRDWEIVLTNIKAFHKDVIESDVEPSADDYFRFVMILFQLSAFLLHLKNIKQQENT